MYVHTCTYMCKKTPPINEGRLYFGFSRASLSLDDRPRGLAHAIHVLPVVHEALLDEPSMDICRICIFAYHCTECTVCMYCMYVHTYVLCMYVCMQREGCGSIRVTWSGNPWQPDTQTCTWHTPDMQIPRHPSIQTSWHPDT
ncbi:hypothetical protein K504DRAFT_158950 [Pleomassaria siparia CBS 279.74]|uniref:Uncharacterized protein n=1 Tax=Pleomassaria siparia CBS 279.74 TaxID=1314801 RepID=A0A6G1JV73_9PLEO|nr:hypothetical protein K504DRAFT_158950 [Pleomassaria siparia CBS 279.74]